MTAQRVGMILKIPLLVFFLIASAIPALILITMGVFPEFYNWAYGGRVFIYEDAVLEAAQRVGYDFVSTNLLERIPAIILEPVLIMPMIYAGAPAIAAVLTILLMGKKGQLGTFFGRFNPFRNSQSWSKTLGFYGIMVAVILIMRLPIITVVGVSDVDWNSVFSLTALYTLFAYALVDQGGLLEEGGWRGFALPYLQDIMSTPLRASILLGIVWSFWHIPRSLMSWETGLLAFVMEYGMFTFGTVATSIVITYFFNRMGGTVWSAIVFHGLINQSFDIAAKYAEKATYPVILNQSLPTFMVYVAIGIAASVVLIKFGPQLGKDDASD